MRFSLSREVFLKPLQQVVNVVERRQTLPVLANLLVSVEDGRLSMTGTDLEVEMIARSEVDDCRLQVGCVCGCHDGFHDK